MTSSLQPIVAIDFSLTSPAIAILDPSTNPPTILFTQAFNHQPVHSSHIHRIIWLAKEITSTILNFPYPHSRPTQVLIEDYGFSANGKITMIAEGCGLLKAYLVSNGLDVHPVSISSWKKVLTGNGRADKALVTQVVNEKFGLTLTGKKGDQDIADAIGVGYWVTVPLSKVTSQTPMFLGVL